MSFEGITVSDLQLGDKKVTLNHLSDDPYAFHSQLDSHCSLPHSRLIWLKDPAGKGNRSSYLEIRSQHHAERRGTWKCLTRRHEHMSKVAGLKQ